VKVKTTRFGEIDVPEDEILYVPLGLIGFPASHRYVLIPHSDDSPFQWLQSLDQEDVAFAVIDPTLLVADYPLEAARGALANKPETVADLAVAVIATVPPAPQPITVNMVAPIAFNVATRQGAQVLLHDDRFRTRHILAAADPEPTQEAPTSSANSTSP
jgi:flagellar assembly factor FliW